MERIKTKIKKFLGIDITPRKNLYRELCFCYDLIKSYQDKIVDFEKIIDNKNKENVLLMEKGIELNKIIENYKNIINNLNKIIDDLKLKINELSANIIVENFKTEDVVCLTDEYNPSEDLNGDKEYTCSDDYCNECVNDCSCASHYNCSDDCFEEYWNNCPCYTMGDYGPINGDTYPYDEYNPSDDIHISFEVGCETFKK